MSRLRRSCRKAVIVDMDPKLAQRDDVPSTARHNHILTLKLVNGGETDRYIA